MKTHYFPDRGFGDEDAERAACGTWLGEGSELSCDWSCITCGKCIRSKEKLIRSSACEDKAIVNQMGDMAEFYAQGAKP